MKLRCSQFDSILKYFETQNWSHCQQIVKVKGLSLTMSQREGEGGGRGGPFFVEGCLEDEAIFVKETHLKNTTLLQTRLAVSLS